MKKVFLLMLSLSFTAISCNYDPELIGETSMEYTPKVTDHSGLEADSANCISTGCICACCRDIICPDDTQHYNTVKLMKYVDSELKKGEPNAYECSCGRNYYDLGNDTLEIYLFLYGSGAGAVWYRMYKRQESSRFELVSSFKPVREGYVEVLNTKHKGVKDFTFKEVQGPKYTLVFNGESFDTLAVNKQRSAS